MNKQIGIKGTKRKLAVNAGFVYSSPEYRKFAFVPMFFFSLMLGLRCLPALTGSPSYYFLGIDVQFWGAVAALFAIITGVVTILSVIARHNLFVAAWMWVRRVFTRRDTPESLSIRRVGVASTIRGEISRLSTQYNAITLSKDDAGGTNDLSGREALRWITQDVLKRKDGITFNMVFRLYQPQIIEFKAVLRGLSEAARENGLAPDVRDFYRSKYAAYTDTIIRAYRTPLGKVSGYLDEANEWEQLDRVFKN